MNRPLKLGPETLDRVGMDIALNVLPFAVVDGFMEMPDRPNFVVGVGLIGRNDRTSGNHRLNKWRQGNLLDVLNRHGFDFAFSFDSTENRGLASGTTTTLTTANTTDIGFVQFDDFIAVQRIRSLLHKHTNLLIDSPSALIGNAKVPFEFLGGDTVLTLANQKNSMKPHSKRRWAFMKNRPFGGIGLVSASASIRAAVSHWMERRLAALRTFQAIGVTLLKDMSQASLIVGEVLFKVFNGVSHV